MRIGPDDFDWAAGELLQLWSFAHKCGVHPYRLAPMLYVMCMDVIRETPYHVKRDIDGLLDSYRQGWRNGNTQPKGCRGVPAASPRGTTSQGKGGADSRGEGGAPVGIPARRPCELPSLPLFSESASAASDTEEGGV